MTRSIERICVVGGGLMGHGIAQVFASHGHQVTVYDTSSEALSSLEERVKTNLNRLALYDLLDAPIEDTLSRIQTTDNLATACSTADIVFEAASENLALKQKIFCELEAVCQSSTILCSNTSVMSISEIAAKCHTRSRIVGTHWWNPPYLVPLVEVIKGEDTGEEQMSVVNELLGRVGKHPVYVRKDVPGFVGNRLQHALWREAFYLIDSGVCDPKTIDEVIRNGFGMRLPVLGPVENADLIGLDLTLSIHEYILPHLCTDAIPSGALSKHVVKGDLGMKSGSGFLPWSTEDVASSREALSNYLMKTLSERRPEVQSGIMDEP